MTAAPTKPRPLTTGSIRMRYDLIEMLDAITWSRGFSNVADGIDAILREEITALFNDLPEAIRQRAVARIEAENA
jgi:hypothetical protein